MPFIHFSPITIKTLNNGIDADLLFNNVWGRIGKVDGTGVLSIYGELPTAGKGSVFRVEGWNGGLGSGGWMIGCADNAGDTKTVLMGIGNVAAPYTKLFGDIHADSHRIYTLGQATADMDAVPQTKIWGTWTPTLTWGTADPAAPLVTARYCQIGKTVYFNFFVTSNDSNACSSLTATLPVAPKANGVYNTFTGFEYRATVGVTDPRPYNLQSGSLISFWGFLTGVDAQVIQINVSGFYEVA